MKKGHKLLRAIVLVWCLLFVLTVFALPLSVFSTTDGGGTWANYGALLLALLQAFTPLFALVLCVLLLLEAYFSYRLGAISKKRLLYTVLLLATAAAFALVILGVLLYQIDAANHGTLSQNLS